MSQIPRPAPKEQQLLGHARREGLLLMAVWALALLWSVGYSRLFGYDRNADDIPLILGMPDWVFWGIAVPWVICFLFTTWFCFFFMADDDLGRDADEGHGHDA
jgi:hypothetical protein